MNTIINGEYSVVLLLCYLAMKHNICLYSNLFNYLKELDHINVGKKNMFTV